MCLYVARVQLRCVESLEFIMSGARACTSCYILKHKVASSKLRKFLKKKKKKKTGVPIERNKKKKEKTEKW